MGSSTYNDASHKKLEDELIDAGSRLLMLSSSTDELLSLLEKAEKLLSKIRQQPPRSTGDALLPVMKALVTDDLLKHMDVNVRVAVASCINELTRITAPNPPYSDDEMKEIFQLFMVAFKHLSYESGPNYSRATQILETVAKVRSCLILLDINCDALVAEMFQLFFATIRCNHPTNILKYMEMIMTLMIEESDEISFELLRPLLASVRKENKDISPVSLELGETIFRTCGTKLKPCLREAVRTMNLDIDDHVEILSSLCEDLYDGNDLAAEEAASAGTIAAVGLTGAGVTKVNGLSKTEPEDKNPLIKENFGSEQLINNSSRSGNKEVDAVEMLQTEMDKPVRKRGRKPKSFSKPKEAYEGKDSCEVSCNGESKDDLSLPSGPGKGSLLNHSSHKEYDSVSEVSLSKRGRSKKNERTTTHGSKLELASTPKLRILRTVVKENGSNTPKGTDKKKISGSRINKAKNEEGLDTQPMEKVATNSQKHESLDVPGKMVESPSVSVAARSKHPKDLPSTREKISGGSRVDYGEELVDLRIQVWWPMDRRFYEGSVVAFDPVSKKHKISYDDGEVEILNLRKERWEILHDKKPGQADLPHKEVADHVSAKGSAKTGENTAKRKVFSSRKQKAASSSKRSRNENLGASKPVDDSAPNIIHQKDETNVSSEHDEEILGGKEELETTSNKTGT